MNLWLWLGSHFERELPPYHFRLLLHLNLHQEEGQAFQVPPDLHLEKVNCVIFVWRVWTLHIACSISVKQLASAAASQAIQSVSASVPVTRATARSRSVATVSAPVIRATARSVSAPVPVTRTMARSRSVATVSAPVPVTRTTTTGKTEGRSKIVACFKRYGTSRPSQSEIFFYVIVACSLCSCVLAFQEQHTLPK